MKKILTLSTITLILVLVALGLNRYRSNKTSLTPYPFIFENNIYHDIEAKAPILIIGDRMGQRLASFKDLLSEKLSVNLSKPITIATLAHEGDNIHRTLEKLRNLSPLPLIIIYIGNTDQAYENLYDTKYLRKIRQNFTLYKNDKFRSLLMVLPSISRFLYKPIKYTMLSRSIYRDENKYDDPTYQKRMEIQYLLYESALDELLNMAKKSASLVIPITTPLNLEKEPNRSCYGSLSANSKDDIAKLKKLISMRDYKGAYTISKELALINPSHAQILHLHAMVSKKLNYFDQAQNHGEKAIAFDCGNKDGNPIFNVILKRLSKQYQYNYFDFHQLITDESQHNPTFLDDIYPQDVYFNKMINLISVKIKRRLKL